MDKILRTITSDGSLMASAIDSSQIVYTAQKIHGLTKTSCAALGRLLTGASLMGNMLKTDGASLTLKVNGGGPLGNLVAISDSHGNVRGYVDFPEVELPLKPNGKIDVGGGVGNQGRLAVIRDLGEGDGGALWIESGGGMCALGVLVDKESGEAMRSGGMLIQPLPGADNAALDRLEQNIAQLDSVTTMLAKGMGPEEMCRAALEGFEVEILDQAPVYYACNCSKERFARGLLTLGAKELLSLHGDEREQVETVCHYCNKKYVFTKAEIAELAKQAAKTGKKVF